MVLQSVFVNLFDNFDYFANGDCTSFITEGKATHLREVLEDLQTERLLGFEPQDAFVVLLHESRLLLFSCFLVDNTNHILKFE